MKKFLLLILALVLCFSFVGCGRSDICEYKTENDVLLFKIRKTPTFDGQHFSKIEFLNYNDEVDQAYYARKNTYLTISNNIPISDELPFTLSKETFDHYGANPNGTFYIKIVEINKESGHPVFEEIRFINGSSIFGSSMERRFFLNLPIRVSVIKPIELRFFPEKKQAFSANFPPKTKGKRMQCWVKLQLKPMKTVREGLIMSAMNM